MKKIVIMTTCLAMLGNSSMIVNAETQNNVCINEICAKNTSFTAPDGNYYDWIELYNSSNKSIDISGYGLSDSSDAPPKYTFPQGTVIEAGKYLIVFCDSTAIAQGDMLFASMGLSKNGETIVLTDTNGNAVDTLTFGAIETNVTYGRIPDGSDILAQMTPTPYETNAVSVSAPVFSQNSGFYGTDFQLSLTAESNSTIYYTLDGSDPSSSDTAIEYDGSINIYDRTSDPNVYSNYQHDDTAHSITLKTKYKAPNYNVDKATVIRAVAKDKDGNTSNIVTNTYFVFPQDKLKYYKDISVVSLVTDPKNLFDADTGIYVAGNQYLDWKNSSLYDPAKSEWDTDNTANFFSKGREWERPVSFTVFENGEMAHSQDMGIRIKGASTRNSAQKSFNLYARSDYGESKFEYPILEDNISEVTGKNIKKYDSISLRNTSWHDRLNDTVAQPLLTDRNAVSTQNMKPCVVFLDGEFWGFYQIIEKYSDYYIQSHYNVEKEYVAMIKNSELEEGTSKDESDFWTLNNSLDSMDLSDSSVYQEFSNVVDIDSLVEHYCAGIYLGTYDWPNYNYGVWRYNGSEIAGNKYTDGKWRFLCFDFDYTIGLTYASFGGVQGFEYDSFTHVDNNKKYIPAKFFTKCSENDEFKKQFALTYCDYANYVMSPDTVEKLLIEHEQTMAYPYAQGSLRWCGYANNTNAQSIFNGSVTNYQNTYLSNVRNFFEKRATYTLEDMKNYFGLTGTCENITLKTNGNGQIKINTIIPEMTNGSWTGQYFTDYPVTVTAIPDDNQTFEGWSGYIQSDEPTITVPFSTAITLQANFSTDLGEKGDINANGVIDLPDLVILKKHIMNVQSMNTEQIEYADIVSDDKINAFDVSAMKKELLK